MNEKALLGYIQDLGEILKEESRDTHSSMLSAAKDDAEWRRGEVATYYRIISWAQERAEHYGLSLEEVNLDGLDPDKDLHIPK